MATFRRAQLFSPEECRVLVALADATGGWRAAATGSRGEGRVRRRRRRARQISIAGENAAPGVRDRFESYLARVERLVVDLDRAHFRLGVRGVHDAQLVDYVRGGFYEWHRDAHDHAFRKLTALCYLTDGASDGVSGGETGFAPPPLDRVLLHPRLRRVGPGWLRWLPLVQTPRQGRVVVFDATLPHRAYRVRAGRKVSLNVWLA